MPTIFLIFSSLKPTVSLSSITPDYIKEIQVNDEIINTTLFSKAKNGFYAIKTAQLQSVSLFCIVSAVVFPT